MPIDLTWDDSPIDVTKEVNFIWSIANKLRWPYQSDKYKDVIIPMTIIRRFECALKDTKDAVVKQYEANQNYPAKAMYKISGFKFYNTSKYTLAELINDPDNLASNFKSYIGWFSANIQDIIKNLEFDKQIDKMNKHNRLLSVVKAFSEIDLDPRTIDNIKMGYIFEELIRKFSENAEAWDHYTWRDIIKLMVSILLAEWCDDLFEAWKVITILDQAAGTGWMVSTANNFIKRFNPDADIRLFTQEVNPESYAMCLAEMLIRGQDADNIRLADTMKEDCFPDIKMRLLIENPPFGQPWWWKDAAEWVEEAVKTEAAKEHWSRFPAWVPSTTDMQLLFIQSAIDKMDDKLWRAAIIENGSPMFSWWTASWESQIRRRLLENDYIEAIIQLSSDMFYNTPISTYIWILSKNKKTERKWRVQLINASDFSHKLRKALWYKRNEITKKDREEITKLYSEFKENKYCQIYDTNEFLYKEYSVYQPLQRSYAITQERIDKMISLWTLSWLYDEWKIYELENSEELTWKDQIKLDAYEKNKPIYDKIIETLNNNISEEKYNSLEIFLSILTALLKDIADKSLIEKIANGLSMMDKEADIQKDKKWEIIWDKESKDIELVPYKMDIDDYMKKEVLPYIPDAKAIFEEDLWKKKPVIKTWAEIPFTRYFYEYQEPMKSDDLKKMFIESEEEVNKKINNLFA